MAAAPPRTERRRNPRIVPRNYRVWLVSGEFDEIYTTVNFARSLLNIGPGGACVETTGRLRPDVKMSLEVTFDGLNGALRTGAKIVWVDTRTEGGQEFHKAGLIFTGQMETTQAVRVYLKGQDPSKIIAEKKADYKRLKSDSEARRAGLGRRKPIKIAAYVLALLIMLYVAGFGAAVLLGKTTSSAPGLHFRYAKGGRWEDSLSTLFSPAYWLFRKAGVPIVYDGP